MARPGIQKDDVFAAIEELSRKGVPTTVANVRQELGTGSYSTLLPLITEYQTLKRAEPEPLRALPAMPSEIAEAATKFITDLWAMAAEHADTRVRELEAKAAAREAEQGEALKAKTEELNQAFTDIQKLEAELETLKSVHEASEKRASGLEVERDLLTNQLKELGEGLKAAQERSAVAEKLSESRARELTEFEKQQEKLKTQLESQTAKTQQYEKDVAVGVARLELLGKQLFEKDSELRSLLERAASAERELSLVKKKDLESGDENPSRKR